MIYISLIISLLLIIARQYFKGSLNKQNRDLTNSYILITGGSAGIGKSTVIELCKHNPKMIIIANRRNIDIQSFSNKNIDIQQFKLDLASLKSIQEFSYYLINILKIPKIDILINNAAIMGTINRELTNHKIEKQFATNYLGHFYLTQQLIPLLNKSKYPRVINVASVAHTYEDLKLEDINLDRWSNSPLWSRYYTYRAYGNSKISLIMHAQYLSTIYPNIKAISVHPGIVRSEILKHQLEASWAKYLLKVFYPFFWYFTKDCEHGCQTTLHGIMLNDENIVQGGYYAECKLSQPQYTNPKRAKELWEFTIRLLKEIEPKI